MCTLIVLHRCVQGRPLVVAANRDEFLSRPAEGPALRPSKNGPIVAPLDLEAGGTWVGLNARGVFAGLTNLRPFGPPGADLIARTGLRSRGELVMEALEAESAAAAVREISRLEEGETNPFQLLVADGREAWLIVYRDRPRAIELTAGAHVVGNVEDERIAAALGVAWTQHGPSNGADENDGGGRRATSAGASAKSSGSGSGTVPGFEGVEGLIDSDEPRALKLTRIRERVEKLLTDPGHDLFDGLAGICREHVDPDQGVVSPFEATCVHVADRYGTRSSMLLELAEDPGSSRLWTTDGPPCERSFENRSSLLKELGVRPRF